MHPSKAAEQIFLKLSRMFHCGLNPTLPSYTLGAILGRRVTSKGPEKGNFGLQLWLHRNPFSWKGIAVTSGHPPLPHSSPIFVLQILCYLAPDCPWELAFSRVCLAAGSWHRGFLPTPASRSWDWQLVESLCLSHSRKTNEKEGQEILISREYGKRRRCRWEALCSVCRKIACRKREWCSVTLTQGFHHKT